MECLDDEMQDFKLEVEDMKPDITDTCPDNEDTPIVNQEELVKTEVDEANSQTFTQVFLVNSVKDCREEEQIASEIEDTSAKDRKRPISVKQGPGSVEELSLGKTLESAEGVDSQIKINIEAMRSKVKSHMTGTKTGTITSPALPRLVESPPELPDVVNCVQHILKKGSLTLEEKILMKKMGRPTPELNLVHNSRHRTFNTSWYSKYEWMCGCSITHKLYCFMCLLSSARDDSWSSNGFSDIKHLKDRAGRHMTSVVHLKSYMDYVMLDKKLTGNSYLENKQNESVDMLRYLMRKLIVNVVYCSAFDNISSSVGPANLDVELSSVFAAHCPRKLLTNQTKLLNALYEVYQQELLVDINSATFVALEVAELIDSLHQRRIAMFIRTVRKGRVYVHFWTFLKVASHTVEEITAEILQELATIFGASKENLIAQSYNLTLDNGQISTIQRSVNERFPNAHFVHNYTHPLKAILHQSTQSHKEVKLFFAELDSLRRFFKGPATKILSIKPEFKVLKFDDSTVNTVYENQNFLKTCLNMMINNSSTNLKLLGEAKCCLRILECPGFHCWLNLFRFIVPQVEFHVMKIEEAETASAIFDQVQTFEQKMRYIENAVNVIEKSDDNEPARKKQKIDNRSAIATEICNSLVAQVKHKFNFVSHVTALELFDFLKYETYKSSFPTASLSKTLVSYPMLSSNLKQELTAIYSCKELRRGSIWALLSFICENNLENAFSETYKLLNVLCITPTPGMNREAFRSKLQGAENILKGCGNQERLNALVALSLESHFIRSARDFENKVIAYYEEDKTEVSFGT